jgi:hypothetical protein
VHTARHGGGCCGINHLQGFYGLNKENRERLVKQFKDLVANYKKRSSRNMMLEVAITDGQAKQWAPYLKEEGFEHVHRFRNGNSGNYVNLFVFSKGRVRKAQPFEY